MHGIDVDLHTGRVSVKLCEHLGFLQGYSHNYICECLCKNCLIGN